jgi:hypothetical protein
MKVLRKEVNMLTKSILKTLPLFFLPFLFSMEAEEKKSTPLSGTSLAHAPSGASGINSQRKLAIENALKLLQTEIFCKAEQAMNFHMERFYPQEKELAEQSQYGFPQDK